MLHYQEDDLGALIYRESQLRKKEAAAAAAAAKNERSYLALHRCDGFHPVVRPRRQILIKAKTHLRKVEIPQRKGCDYPLLTADADGVKEATKKPAKKKYRYYECSSDGCTNIAIKGGV